MGGKMKRPAEVVRGDQHLDVVMLVESENESSIGSIHSLTISNNESGGGGGGRVNRK